MMRSIATLMVFFCSNGLCLGQVVNVSTASQLQAALNAATAGQTIQVADGVYISSSGFSVPKNVNGTSAQPIIIKGSRNAILSTGDSSKNYGFWLKGNKYWIIKDFTVRLAKKGIMLDSSYSVTVDNVLVKKIGEEGIHIRTYSSYNTIQNCFIDSTGLHTPDYGEGIYVGSAVSNWPVYTAGNMDTCNYNKLLSNQFGAAINAENIDIKEGTTGGEISGNSFNGTGLNNTHFADSWVDMKGNYYTIQNNTGSITYTDGFQTHINYPGFGNYNTFSNNTMNIPGAPGYGIRIQTSGSNGTASGNKVCNNNLQLGGALGLTNISTTVCNPPLAAPSLLSWSAAAQTGRIEFRWSVSSIVDIKHFVIEVSEDGGNFSALRNVPVFSLIYHEKVSAHQSFFRLKIILNTGDVSFSPVIKLNPQINDIKVFQQQQSLGIVNPFSSNLFYKIIDAKGRIIKVGLLASGLNSIRLESQGVGLHVVQVFNKQLKIEVVKKILL